MPPSDRSRLSRREVLRLALPTFVARGFSRAISSPQPVTRRICAIGASASLATPTLDRASLIASPRFLVAADGSRPDGIEIVRNWKGRFCRSRVVSHRRDAIRVKEIVLFEVPLALPLSTAIYGEGFQMLSQTGGTLGEPVDYSQYTDAGHYRMPAGEGARAFYGLLLLMPPGDDPRVLAFTSCDRFSGRFEIRDSSLRAIIDAEGLELGPGEMWALEEMMFASEPKPTQLLSGVATRLATHHPPPQTIRARTPPTGWCSWYCFGPTVTAQQVLDNLDAIARGIPALTYIQIDDGYQRAMGDWLDTGAAFGGSVRAVLDQIRRRRFEPAIWIAPFVAEESSALFQQHRDWFIADRNGQGPLRADRVTFGGWRRGPWYALDGTHPEVQQHFERLFRIMRQDWGCSYFKLDANFWGAMHGGRFHDPRATRIEAYRRGMQAILRGAGDAFVLGGNHPIWPSLGLLHGSRSSNDIKRSWDRIRSTAQQNLSRNWQNGRLWWNDPDVVVLTGDLPDREFEFHATAIYASGGLVLSGDDLTSIPPARLAMLRKLLPPTGVAATFDEPGLRVGVVQLPHARMMCLFNWSDVSQSTSFRLPRPADVADHWSGESLGRHDGMMTLEMPPRSARLLACT